MASKRPLEPRPEARARGRTIAARGSDRARRYRGRRWARSTRSPTRRAGWARPPRRSTSRPASPRPATRRCSSTSTRRPTRRSGSASQGPRPSIYDVLTGDARARRRDRRVDDPGPPSAPGEPRPRGRERRAAATARLGDAPARRAGAVARALRLHAPRLPAVARPAHRQRAGRGRSRDRPRADRVLRARGPRRAARHARRSSSASSTRASRSPGCC